MKKWLLMLLCICSLTFVGCSSDDSSSSSSSSSGGKPAQTHTHTDANGDNACDGCQASIQTTIDFYSINDLHGKFDDTYANIGVDEMSTYLRNAKTTNENTILLSAGDMWQGSAESNYTKGNLITEWMNELDFAAMSMGNHEFDWGESYVEANAAIADFPFLGINVYDRATNQRVDYCDASVMVEVSGVKVGIIGAIGDCYSSIAYEQVEDIYFKTKGQLTALVKAESTKLQQQGANVIVYVLHDSGDGSSYYDPSLSNGYVDLVFEGHSHTEVHRQDAYGVWHLQAGGDNSKGLSHAKISVNLLTDTVTVNNTEIVRHSTYQNLPDDPIVDSLLNKYADKLAPINEVLGVNASYRDYDELANYAAKSYYALGKARWGDNPAYQGKIVLGGGYLNVRSPYYLPAGTVKYGDLYPLFTFDNPLVLCKVSGSRLKTQFIESTNYYMYYGEDGNVIKNNVVDTETYYVVVDTYCANYDFQHMGFLEIVEYFDDAHLFFGREAIVEYTRQGGLSNNPPSPESIIIDTNTGGGGDNTGSGGDNTGGGDGDNTGSGGDNTGSGGDNTGSGGDNTGGDGDNTGGGGDNTGGDGDNTGGDGDNTGGDNTGNTGDQTVYTDISAIHTQSSAFANISARGVVVAVGQTGFLFSDGTGVIMYYSGSAPLVTKGDKVVVSGPTSLYSNNQQFSANGGAMYEVKDVDVPAYSTPTPTVWDKDDVENYDGKVGQFVTVTASFYKTNKYYNANKFDDSCSHQLSLIEPTSDVLKNITISSTAQELVVTGYTCYTVSGKFVYIMATEISLANDDGSNSETLSTLAFASSFGGKGISEYATGNYGSYTLDNTSFEYYRAYKPSGETEYILRLLPYISSATDGSFPASLYNTTPIYGICSITITYKSSVGATLYTGDDRTSMTAHTLPAATSYQTQTLTIDTDNFLQLNSSGSDVYVQALSVSYTNEYAAYNSAQKQSGAGAYRLNATTFNGTLVAGQSSVSVPVKVVYDGGSCQVLQTKTYTYYTLDYVKAHPTVKSAAAMLTPQDVSAYYSAFKQFPANYAQKNFSTWNDWDEVETVFGDDTRYVSKYDRVTGYAQYVPFQASNTTYYELDIDVLDYAQDNRGVGRVVAWEAGWNSAAYSSAPVCVYTDDHYATFQEYLGDGTFGGRFDAERRLTNTQWSAPTTVAI